jgi:hypothetical protein
MYLFVPFFCSYLVVILPITHVDAVFLFFISPFKIYLRHEVKVSDRRANDILLGDRLRAK